MLKQQKLARVSTDSLGFQQRVLLLCYCADSRALFVLAGARIHTSTSVDVREALFGLDVLLSSSRRRRGSGCCLTCLLIRLSAVNYTCCCTGIGLIHGVRGEVKTRCCTFSCATGGPALSALLARNKTVFHQKKIDTAGWISALCSVKRRFGERGVLLLWPSARFLSRFVVRMVCGVGRGRN